MMEKKAVSAKESPCDSLEYGDSPASQEKRKAMYDGFIY